jgi:predicted AlkP superfamily pyrophosphatase or phosphodiesterase
MRKAALFTAIALLAAGGGAFALLRETSAPSVAEELATTDRTFQTNDPMERACSLPEEYLVRIQRGHDPDRSEDVTIVPQEPNYPGTFDLNSHTGPWDYVQRVPLILYGPGRIDGGELDGDATLADIYPTVGQLTSVELPQRDGTVLSDAIAVRTEGTPRMIVAVMWDGVGTNVLQRWPDAWPHLARLAREGAHYTNAIVGSSPSITPATHSTLGTGVFPETHRVTGVQFRAKDGGIDRSFAARNPSIIAIGTFADRIDKELGNQPLVGLVGWQQWHLGMIGHGSSIAGGDADHVALIEESGEIKGGDAYSTPNYLNAPGIGSMLENRIEELDRADGAADGRWRGRDIQAEHNNPAWIEFEADLILELWDRAGYGSDAVPDLFFTNFKATDLIGHTDTMDSPAMAEVLGAQDAALGRLVEYLEDEVKDYVLIVTADHGSTPRADTTGAWPIDQVELTDDLDDHFSVTGPSLVEQTTAAGYFLDSAVMSDHRVTTDAVARYLNSYRLAENWDGSELPEDYRARRGEHVFAAAFPSDDIDDIAACAGSADDGGG